MRENSGIQQQLWGRWINAKVKLAIHVNRQRAAVRFYRRAKPKCNEIALSCGVLVIGLLVGGAIAQIGPLLYVVPNRLPAPAKAYLGVFGDRIQKPGNERTILSGVYSDSSGSSAAQLSWQVPGELRFDRANKAGFPIIYNSVSGLLGIATLSAADANFLESLLDDSTETFLYSFGSGYAHRFLGGMFRADDGKAANYKGPWYEVHEVTGNVRAQTSTTTRSKIYCFDSSTKLLAKTSYSAGSIKVVTEYTGWATKSGQSFPGKIIRLENGVQVASFTVSSATFGLAANDGLFSGGN